MSFKNGESIGGVKNLAVTSEREIDNKVTWV